MSSSYNELIPGSVEECYKTDEITQALINWSQRVLSWGMMILILTVICGLFVSISVGLEAESFFAFLTAALPFAITALCEYFVFKLLSFIILVVASFHENSMITANVALYRAAKDEGYFSSDASTEKPLPPRSSSVARTVSNLANKNNVSSSNGWICNKCGTKNPNYMSYCGGCGENK